MTPRSIAPWVCGPALCAAMSCQALFGVDEPEPEPTGRAGAASAASSAASSGGGAAGASGAAGGTAASSGGGGAGGGCSHLDVPDGGTPGDCSKPNMIEVAFEDGSPFCIDRWEVRRQDYKAWLDSCPALADQRSECQWNDSFVPVLNMYDCDPAQDALDVDPERPVVCIDWCDADAYCRGVGKRLCGAKGGGSNGFGQWANAASSEWYSACSDHGTRAYTYGPTYQAATCVGFDYEMVPGPVNVAHEVPVSSCKDPEYNLWDMSGNVWEWENSCQGTQGKDDVCRDRGGSFWEMDPVQLQCDVPSPMNHTRGSFNNNVGIRCCSDVNP